MLWMSLIGAGWITICAWVTIVLNQRKEIRDLRSEQFQQRYRLEYADAEYRQLLKQHQALQVVVSELQKGHPYR